jgi:hypothetical protein
VIGFLGTKDLLIVAGVIVVLVLIAARFLLHDRDVKRTRFGFFVERDRYQQEEDDYLGGEPPWPRNLPSSLDLEDTKEIPPQDKEV